MKNVIKPLAKSVSIPYGLAAAALATDIGIHQEHYGSWVKWKISEKNPKP